MIHLKMRELKKHCKVKHPGIRKKKLQRDQAPLLGYWWCTRATRSTNEKWLNLGTHLLTGQTNQRKLIDFCKSSLQKGFKVPYEFQEYGIPAVNEMFQQKEHLSKRRKLKYPSDALLEEYYRLGTEIGDSDGTSQDSAPQTTTSPNKQPEHCQTENTDEIAPYLMVTRGLQTPSMSKPDLVTLLCQSPRSKRLSKSSGKRQRAPPTERKTPKQSLGKPLVAESMQVRRGNCSSDLRSVYNTEMGRRLTFL